MDAVRARAGSFDEGATSPLASWWSPFVRPALGTASLVTGAILAVRNRIWPGSSHPAQEAALDTAAGLALWTGAELLVPPRVMKVARKVFRDNVHWAYFALIQGWGNTDNNPGAARDLEKTITFMGSALFAAKAAAAFTKKLKPPPAHDTPLTIPLEPSSKWGLLGRDLVVIVIGGSLFWIGSAFNQSTLKLVGLPIASMGGGALLVHSWTHLIPPRNTGDLMWGDDLPTSFLATQRVGVVVREMTDALAGVPFAFSQPVAIAVGSGAFGGLFASNVSRFQERIDDDDEDVPPIALNVQKVINVIVGLGMASWYGLAMSDAENMPQRLSLSLFLGGLALAEAIQRFAERRFSADNPDQPWTNLAYALTHREGGFMPLVPFLVVTAQMPIDDRALLRGPVVLPALAWASWGAAFRPGGRSADPLLLRMIAYRMSQPS